MPNMPDCQGKYSELCSASELEDFEAAMEGGRELSDEESDSQEKNGDEDQEDDENDTSTISAIGFD